MEPAHEACTEHGDDDSSDDDEKKPKEQANWRTPASNVAWRVCGPFVPMGTGALSSCDGVKHFGTGATSDKEDWDESLEGWQEGGEVLRKMIKFGEFQGAVAELKLARNMAWESGDPTQGDRFFAVCAALIFPDFS
jgi:hypothetical protein